MSGRWRRTCSPSHPRPHSRPRLRSPSPSPSIGGVEPVVTDDSSSATTNTDPDRFVERDVVVVVGYAFGPKKMETMGAVMAEASASGAVSSRGRGGADLSDEECSKGEEVRVSFVPLDLDKPLEDQHGGRFDVILHKMTEDILCLSEMRRTRGPTTGDFDASDDPTSALPMLTQRQQKAIRRIDRLRQYRKPQQNLKPKLKPNKQTTTNSKRCFLPCALVDPPDAISVLMNRADMARVLDQKMDGVTTKSGVRVRTPRFHVVEGGLLQRGEDCGNGNGVATAIQATTGDPTVTSTTATASLARDIDAAKFRYPLIAKPLTAAGTKSSHQMGIVLARDGLARLKTPCLLQEYANHGGTLFKAYVMGDRVWVFSRASLPDLPTGELHPTPAEKETYVQFERTAGSRSYVEFDSQRPYPKLADFGMAGKKRRRGDDKDIDRARDDDRQHRGPGRAEPTPSDPVPVRPGNVTPSPPPEAVERPITVGGPAGLVTADEIAPVTAALREAFGLELFGFDLLVRERGADDDDGGGGGGVEILVVDVNYFPGYKEISNFPSLLAQYLVRRALKSRTSHSNASGSVSGSCGSEEEEEAIGGGPRKGIRKL